jgi:muramoyltetrapeptide carboxypeptidase
MMAKALRKGDLISLIAPASAPIAAERIENSVTYFERLGYRVAVGKHATDKLGYLAATDKARLDDLHAAFRNTKVKAIFYLRGGYGSIRLLPEIDYELLAKNPKIFVGYSDATAMFLSLYKHSGFRSAFYGPMPAVDIWNGFDPFAEEQFWRALTSAEPLGELPMNADEGLLLGNAKKFEPVNARVLGGNLTVFSSLGGTPYLPSLSGSALFFEDVDERPYRIDRYLAQLRAMGTLPKIKAVLLGQFDGCEAEEGKPSLTVDEIMQDYFGKLGIPVLCNLPSGHVPRQWTIPVGAKYRIEAKKGRGVISVVESVLE